MDDGDTPGTTVGPSPEAMEVARLSGGHFCVLAGIGTLREMMEDSRTLGHTHRRPSGNAATAADPPRVSVQPESNNRTNGTR